VVGIIVITGRAVSEWTGSALVCFEIGVVVISTILDVLTLTVNKDLFSETIEVIVIAVAVLGTTDRSIDIEQTEGWFTFQAASGLRAFLTVLPLTLLTALCCLFNIEPTNAAAIGEIIVVLLSIIAHKLEIWRTYIAKCDLSLFTVEA
jgi:hypothetical protein